MKRKEIEFVIDKDGSVVSTIKGVKGTACKNFSDAFNDIGKVESESRTPEYYEQSEQVSVSVFTDNKDSH